MRHNILVVKNRALGDSIIGLSTISFIKQLLPNAKVTYAVPAWILPLYKHLIGAYDQIVPIDLNGLGGYWAMLKQLKTGKYDHVIELHRSGRSGNFLKIYSKLTNTPYSFHNHNLTSGGPILDQGKRKPSIQRDLDGAWTALNPLVKADVPSYLDFQPLVELKESVPRDEHLIVLGMVATRRPKMWPISYFKNLVEKVLEIDRKWKFIVPISNSKLDRQVEKEFEHLHFSGEVTLVKESLENLPAVIGSANYYIGNDTGLKHLAISLGLKTYTFFGPEEPFEWHPYDENIHPYFYLPQMECRTRSSHFCGINSCDNHRCMEEITVDQVLNKLELL